MRVAYDERSVAGQKDTVRKYLLRVPPRDFKCLPTYVRSVPKVARGPQAGMGIGPAGVWCFSLSHLSLSLSHSLSVPHETLRPFAPASY